MRQLSWTILHTKLLIGLGLLLLLLSACQPIVLEVPVDTVGQGEEQSSAPSTIQNPEEEIWRQETLRDLLAAFVFTDPPPDLQSIEASGIFGTAGSPIERILRNLGGHCLLDLTFPFVFSGTVEGTVAATKYQIYSLGPCAEAAPGRFDEVWQATGTFEGTVDGRKGTFDFLYVAEVNGGGDEAGTFDARMAILRGTDELTTLHGVLIAKDQPHGVDPSLPSPEYTGNLYFDENISGE